MKKRKKERRKGKKKEKKRAEAINKRTDTDMQFALIQGRMVCTYHVENIGRFSENFLFANPVIVEGEMSCDWKVHMSHFQSAVHKLSRMQLEDLRKV